MKERVILFPYDSDVERLLKVEIVKEIAGKDNVNEIGLNYHIPEIKIKCTWKQWKEIRFRLDLSKAYY